MKKFLLPLLFAVALPTFPACTTTPTTQSVEVRTLSGLGITAKAGIDTAANLLSQGKITVAQFQTVARYYDGPFQVAFDAAKTAAHADLSSIASPDLTAVAAKLALLVTELTTKTP